MKLVNFPSLEKVLQVYMASLSEDSRVESAAELCRRAGISRTTFYKHFESLDDLDERFLALYFVTAMGTETQAFHNSEQLAAFYLRLVRAMREHAPFFSRLVSLPSHAAYHARWFVLVDERLKPLFRLPGQMMSAMLWGLHLEFALGVVHRYLELGLNARSQDLAELTHWMMEFLWGGVTRLRALSEGTATPMDKEMTRSLEWRASQQPDRANRASLVKVPNCPG